MLDPARGKYPLLTNALNVLQTYKVLFGLFFCMLVFSSAAVSVFRKQFGLTGAYYSNMEWQGEPVVSRVESTPYLKGETGPKLLSTNIFSVTWSGWIVIAKSGSYRFATYSDDGSHLWIDGQEIVTSGADQAVGLMP